MKLIAAAVLPLLIAHGATADDRPNVLWITSEDNSCYLGCYGDPQAHTPNLDRLAAQGLRYRNAFANAPVCSTARTTLITGMHASSLGLHNHRSRGTMPQDFKLYPEILREAGYYCTNNVKEDYNVSGRRNIWDESSRQAHYRNRGERQPFFAVFNSTTTHESRVAAPENKTDFRIPPEEFELPPYHPDTEAIRRDWSNYYDQMTALDREVAEQLEELEREGVADNTIVFYYSDHGGALPGGKRNIHDVGTRVPLIIRFPEKWAHLTPHNPGDWVEEPVSFIDLLPTLLSICGAEVPSHYEGIVFLGENRSEPQEFVYLLRGRMDERYDSVRAIRTKTHRYIKNYSPHRPYGQRYTYAFRVQPSMRSWFEEFQAGRTDEVQSIYWKPKPGEEFYDITEDPYELDDLAQSEKHREAVADLRRKLAERLIELKDTVFIPEGMYPHLAARGTLYDYAQSDAYEIERIAEVADAATSRRADALPQLIAAADDEHPVVRYWAATGMLILRQDAKAGLPQLRRLLDDPFADVRSAAAEAIAHLGDPAAARRTLAGVLAEGNPYEILAAQNAVEYLWRDGLIDLAQARELVNAKPQENDPVGRIPEFLNSPDAESAR